MRRYTQKKGRFGVAALFLIACFLSAGNSSIAAEELDIVNRPVNTSGLTGLLFTTAPYTLPRGTVETGASVLYENSVKPDFTETEYPFTITAGIGTNKELALRGSYFSIKEGATTTTTTTHHKTGDLELSYKWNFLPQKEDSAVPGLALIVAGIAPTQRSADMLIDTVSHWGMRIGLSTGSEFNWKDYLLGIYADAQIAGQNLTEKRLRDLYEIVNTGLIFPISKHRNLQMFVEYSLINGKKTISLAGGDYSAITYGLRLVSERFNLTFGAQFLRKQTENYDNSGKVGTLVSMKF
ncbi:MAG TPA: hypothetical protein VF903_07175 [Nitrospirota bacterium]